MSLNAFSKRIAFKKNLKSIESKISFVVCFIFYFLLDLNQSVLSWRKVVMCLHFSSYLIMKYNDFYACVENVLGKKILTEAFKLVTVVILADFRPTDTTCDIQSCCCYNVQTLLFELFWSDPALSPLPLEELQPKAVCSYTSLIL